MRVSTFFTSAAVAVASLSSGVTALTGPHVLDVWVPTITSPNATSVWRHGEKQQVTWDVKSAPKSISNGFSVRLRYNGLISPIILAKAFDPRGGNVTVDVPWVVNGTYSIVLFGDSGNDSKDFVITE